MYSKSEFIKSMTFLQRSDELFFEHSKTSRSFKAVLKLTYHELFKKIEAIIHRRSRADVLVKITPLN